MEVWHQLGEVNTDRPLLLFEVKRACEKVNLYYIKPGLNVTAKDRKVKVEVK